MQEHCFQFIPYLEKGTEKFDKNKATRSVATIVFYPVNIGILSSYNTLTLYQKHLKNRGTENTYCNIYSKLEILNTLFQTL